MTDITPLPTTCGTKLLHHLDLETFKERFTNAITDYARARNGVMAIGHIDRIRTFVVNVTYVFGDVALIRSEGAKIAKYIKENDLGTIYKTETVNNPNTGNRYNTYMWTYNGKIPKEFEKIHKEWKYA